MRALLFLVALSACGVPRDRLGDDRVIDRTTPLFTQIDKHAVLAGERVHVTAWLCDPEHSDDVRMEVIRCPKIGVSERDIQCVANHTEEVLLRGVPERQDELLSFAFDYDIPLDLPLRTTLEAEGYPSFSERIIIRTLVGERQLLQGPFFLEVLLEIPPPLGDAPYVPPPVTLTSVKDAARYTLAKDTVNLLPSGDYYLQLDSFNPEQRSFSGVNFFCTRGCSSPDIKNPLVSLLRLEPGASPVFYQLKTDDFDRYLLQASD